MNKPALVVVVSVALWIVLWIRPAWDLLAGAAVGVAFCGLIGWSAMRYRRSGWLSGILFAVLLLTLPAWVTALLQMYQRR